jgi:hypothetical protein
MSTTALEPSDDILAIGRTSSTWSTPRLLRASLLGIWLGTLLFVAIAFDQLNQTRDIVRTVGKSAAPSIIAAQESRANLADMDASIANELLTSGEQSDAAHDAFWQRDKTAVDRLIDAAENITFGDEERGPIKAIQEDLAVYTFSIGVTLQLADTDDAAAVTRYRGASDYLHKYVVPQADALDAANRRELDKAFDQSSASAGTSRTLVILGGAVALGALLTTQILLFKRTHRLLNLPLAAATIIVIVATLRYAGQLAETSRNLESLRADFDSIHALWQARAVAYDAKGDESRFLLDKAQAAQYERGFSAKTALLLSTGDPAAVAYAARRGDKIKVSGYLVDEWNLVGLKGEQEAAQASFDTWAQYMAIVHQIRDLEQQGKHQDAIALCVGTAQGQSNWAFDQFDQALGKTIDINQENFDFFVTKNLDNLNGFPYQLLIIGLAVAILAWLGLRPRIREYEI